MQQDDEDLGSAPQAAPAAINMTPIDTRNLTLIPHTPQQLLALIESAESYTRVFGLPPADGLRDFLVSKDVSPQWLSQLRTALVADPWTHGFAVLHRGDRTVIGVAGFKGPPGPDATVEIAYGIAPGYQGKGYATDAAGALVGYASASDCVRLIRAHTLPTQNASTRVLTKCGFKLLGETVDPEDGLVWRWEKRVERTQSG